MTKRSIISFLIILLISCSSDKEISDENNIREHNNVIDIHNFHFDSIKTEGDDLEVYITDELSYFDPIQTKQKTLFALQAIQFNSSAIDTIHIYFNMPNRKEDSQVNILASQFVEARRMYRDTVLYQVMKHILYADSLDPKHHFLGGMNTEFAYFVYGDQMIDQAFFGLDAIEMIQEYFIECEQNRFGPASFVIMRYKNNIKTYEEDVKKFAQQIINLIEQKCKHNL